jgi:hypothetical protein
VLCFHIALPFYWEVKTYYVYIEVIPSPLSKLQSEPDTENSMHYILLGQASSPYRLKKILMLVQAGAFIRMVLNGKRPYPDEVLAENFRIKILLEP